MNLLLIYCFLVNNSQAVCLTLTVKYQNKSASLKQRSNFVLYLTITGCQFPQLIFNSGSFQAYACFGGLLYTPEHLYVKIVSSSSVTKPWAKPFGIQHIHLFSAESCIETHLPKSRRFAPDINCYIQYCTPGSLSPVCLVQKVLAGNEVRGVHSFANRIRYPAQKVRWYHNQKFFGMKWFKKVPSGVAEYIRFYDNNIRNGGRNKLHVFRC